VTFGEGEIGKTVMECPLKRNKPIYWIEIELVGEDNQPIPFEEYTVILPDGSPVNGYLDEDGFVRLDGIRTPGDCKISFPNLDKEAWQPLEVLPARPPRNP
jgi:hypothetical protein